MSAKERLQALQASLSERGVVDVKFFFDATHRKSLTSVVSEVVEVLGAVVENRFSELAPFKDTVRS